MINILVIGEICEDIFLYCNVDRLCPEAPVPVLIPEEKKQNYGMAGNVENNLISLNKRVRVTKWVQSKKITKTRYIDSKTNHMFLRLDEGESGINPLKIDSEKAEQLKKYDVVIVSDYDKGFLSLDTLERIGQLSKLSILDSKKRLSTEVCDSFSFIKLNETESKYNKVKDSSKLLITLGSRGCLYKGTIYPSPNPQQTIDVSGAGDTFTAAFILKFFETKKVDLSIKFANEMASLVVSKRGVATPI